MEVLRFVKILNSVNGVHCIGSKTTSVFDFLFTEKDIDAYQFERPDILIPRDDRTLLFEQFQFDSSEEIKKSSSQKRELADVEREFKKSLDDSEVGVVKIKQHEYQSKVSLTNYENNLNRIFDEHFSKYKSYIENYENNKEELKELYNENYEFGFIIEDTTLLPNTLYSKTEGWIVLTPFHLESFKEKLRDNPKVKHIFFIIRLEAGYLVYYFYNDDNLEELSDFIIGKEDRFIGFNTVHISGTAKIPNK